MDRVNKIVDLEELPGLIPAGASVALGGGWFANHPMAAVRQLVRARRDDIHAIALLGTIEVDLLVGARVLSELTFSMVTLEAFGLAQQFRRAVQSGELPITEIPALSLQVALEAGAQSVPFLPVRGPGGSDLVAANPQMFGTASSSFGDEDVMVVKALRPDVAIVHALRCDRLGNAQFEGTFGQDPELAAASDLVIVTCEEIVETAEIAAQPHTTKIPGFLVDAVIEAPFGAHPCSHVPRYAQDAWEILAYQRAAVAGGDEYESYVARLRDESEAEYLTRVLGDDRGAVLGALAQAGPTLEVPS
ncbi:MAG: CoA transferase subunit [Solirubrobacterales bacterium]|jgi:glutaconate CoA-transferase subunit A|nr:CoA transferase subunit [Solirubrobacterales bacterium]